jgi:hypothetical protein
VTSPIIRSDGTFIVTSGRWRGRIHAVTEALAHNWTYAGSLQFPNELQVTVLELVEQILARMGLIDTRCLGEAIMKSNTST